MALCPTGVKTTIEWQYPGEQKQRIEGADGYSIYNGYSLSANVRYRYIAAQAIVQNGIFQGFGTEFNSPSSYQFNGIQQWYVHFVKTLRLNGVTSQVPKYGYPPDDAFDHYTTSTFPPAGYRSISATIWVKSQGVWTSIPVNSTTGLWIKRWEPLNLAGVGTQHEFRVTKNGVVVYQRVTSVPPIVTHFCGDKCPEGTCQCESGDVVCCYDTTTGRVVKSFRK